MKTTTLIIPTLILCIIAVVLLTVAYFKQQELPLRGLRITGTMLLPMVPMLLAAFIIAGQMQVLLPKDTVRQFVGEEAGFKAVLIGSVAGALTPGGPVVSFPIAMSLSKSGASIGCVVAYLVAWALWGLNGLAFELSVLGPRLTLAKRASTLLFPPAAGLLAQALFRMR